VEVVSADDDGVERALAVLRAHPYGPDASPEQERACRVLYRALLGRLHAVCRRVGLDDEEVANVLHPKLHQFFTRDVARIGPTRADLERWMITVCANAARTALAARIRHTARDRAAAPLLAVEAEEEVAVVTEPEVEDAPPAATASAEVGEDEPHWLDTSFPERIDRERFLAAVAALTDKQRLLLHTAFRHVRGREGHRLPATEIARELGLTPASESVRWSELLARLRRACAPPPPPGSPSASPPTPPPPHPDASAHVRR
jgi:hypothetical protein